MSDKYTSGAIGADVPLKDTVGQLFHCHHCQSENIFCNGMSAFNQYFILSGECKDCGEESNFAVTSADKNKLILTDEDLQKSRDGE